MGAAWAAVIACSLHTGVALAGDPDAFSQITPRAPGSSAIGVASIYGGQGLLYSKDGGETFTALCSSMATEPTIDGNGDPLTMRLGGFDPGIVTHDGHILVGDPHGLWIDDGNGCGWHVVPELRNAFVQDLTFDPTDPKVIYGVTGAGAMLNGLFRRNADGSIERVGPQEPFPYYSVRATALPDGGVRLYALAVRAQVPVLIANGVVTEVELEDAGIPVPGLTWRPFYVIRYSDDKGETWTTHEYGVTPIGRLQIDAVDPNNPDRVVVVNHIEGSGPRAVPDLVEVSEDRGETFRSWLTLSAIGGISITPDGTVWLGEHTEGNPEDSRGLWRAEGLLEQAEKLTDYDVWCVDAREDRLEVCQRLEWGTADPKTGAFTKILSLKELGAIHTCEGVDTVAICRNDFCGGRCAHWPEAPGCVEHYMCGPPHVAPETGGSGGTAGAGVTDAGPSEPSSRNSGCSCRTLGGTTRAAQPAGLLAGAALAWLLRVRRARRRSRVTGS